MTRRRSKTRTPMASTSTACLLQMVLMTHARANMSFHFHTSAIVHRPSFQPPPRFRSLILHLQTLCGASIPKALRNHLSHLSMMRALSVSTSNNIARITCVMFPRRHKNENSQPNRPRKQTECILLACVIRSHFCSLGRSSSNSSNSTCQELMCSPVNF